MSQAETEQPMSQKGHQLRDVLIAIPARLDSSRIHHKLLRKIDGIPVIRRTAERLVAAHLGMDIMVLTDSFDIMEVLSDLPVIKVHEKHDYSSGTDRVGSIIHLYNSYRYVINVQADQPFVNPEHVYAVATELKQGIHPIVSVMSHNSFDDANQNRVKVSVDDVGMAKNFTRDRQEEETFLHVGIYGFQKAVLSKLIRLPPSENEKKHRLEQLRWIDHGYNIKMLSLPISTHSIDGPEDLL